MIRKCNYVFKIKLNYKLSISNPTPLKANAVNGLTQYQLFRHKFRKRDFILQMFTSVQILVYNRHIWYI